MTVSVVVPCGCATYRSMRTAGRSTCAWPRGRRRAARTMPPTMPAATPSRPACRSRSRSRHRRVGAERRCREVGDSHPARGSARRRRRTGIMPSSSDAAPRRVARHERLLGALGGQHRPQVARALAARRPWPSVACPVAVAVAVVAVPAGPARRSSLDVASTTGSDLASRGRRRRTRRAARARGSRRRSPRAGRASARRCRRCRRSPRSGRRSSTGG